MPQPHQLPLVSVGAALALACSVLEPTFPEPGLIIFYGDTADISAPASATRGVPFQVSVQTFAGGCTRAIARTETKISRTLAEIRPYNETKRASNCTDDLISLTHTASVQFDQSGSATIRVIGEQRPFQGSGTLNGPAQLEHQVVVQ